MRNTDTEIKVLKYSKEKQEVRKASLVPNGIPRYVRCYDNGGESFDRYTVVFTGLYTQRTGSAFWSFPSARVWTTWGNDV